MAEKVNNLLASLRGEAAEPAAEEAPPPLDMGAAPAASSEEIAPLKEKIEALEAKLEEMAAPPADPEPPKPPEAPTELTVWMHTRLELLEKKLETSQQEAIRANMLLREREEAQRKAQSEIEDLFRSIKEANRSATYDKELRDQYQASQENVESLQQRIALAQLRMVPAEDVMQYMVTEEGREHLASRIKKQLLKIQRESQKQSAPSETPTAGSADPGGQAARPSAPAATTSHEAKAMVDGKVALLLGKISDLEHRLAESERLHREGEQKRRDWETDILTSLKSTRRQWQKSGGPDILVEAALETMVGTLQNRDRLQEEMAALVVRLQDEPPSSDSTPQLRADLAERQAQMRDVQNDIEKQMAIVQAWIQRNKGT
jgi:hypothetical protein